MYSIIGRVGFGLPSNAMTVVGDNDTKYRALLITTRAITKGEEIVIDHFLDWTEPGVLGEDVLSYRRSQCGDLGFELNDKWITLLRQMHDTSLPMNQRQGLLLPWYSNGLVGTDGNYKFRSLEGCQWETIDPVDCQLKIQLTEAIKSGAIFNDKIIDNHSINQLKTADQCIFI